MQLKLSSGATTAPSDATGTGTTTAPGDAIALGAPTAPDAPTTSNAASDWPCLLRDERGLVHVEYLLVLLLVSLPAAAAVKLIGPVIVEAFLIKIAWLALPIP